MCITRGYHREQGIFKCINGASNVHCGTALAYKHMHTTQTETETETTTETGKETATATETETETETTAETEKETATETETETETETLSLDNTFHPIKLPPLHQAKPVHKTCFILLSFFVFVFGISPTSIHRQ